MRPGEQTYTVDVQFSVRARDEEEARNLVRDELADAVAWRPSTFPACKIVGAIRVKRLFLVKWWPGPPGPSGPPNYRCTTVEARNKRQAIGVAIPEWDGDVEQVEVQEIS